VTHERERERERDRERERERDRETDRERERERERERRERENPLPSLLLESKQGLYLPRTEAFSSANLGNSPANASFSQDHPRSFRNGSNSKLMQLCVGVVCQPWLVRGRQ
jgi:hypothetical protein